MQTLKTCSLSDEYKPVCYKDLEGYIPVDGLYDTLRGYSELELQKIRQELGISDPIHVDSDLNMYSRNPVENKAVFDALSKKADADKLSRVAVTGNYNDLKGVPCELPNPQALVIRNQDGSFSTYDGCESIVIKMPQSLKDFKDYSDLPVTDTSIQNAIPFKKVTLNGEELTPTEDKVLKLEVITLKQLQEILNGYITKDLLNSTLEGYVKKS